MSRASRCTAHFIQIVLHSKEICFILQYFFITTLQVSYSGVTKLYIRKIRLYLESSLYLTKRMCSKDCYRALNRRTRKGCHVTCEPIMTALSTRSSKQPMAPIVVLCHPMKHASFELKCAPKTSA